MSYQNKMLAERLLILGIMSNNMALKLLKGGEMNNEPREKAKRNTRKIRKCRVGVITDLWREW